MKIAFVSEDGNTISQHFGRAPFYIILTIENGKIIAREKRDKIGHNQFIGNLTESHDGDARGHGYGADAQDKHSRMAATIADCEVLVAGGMGSGAYESMKQAGIKPIITDMINIDEAAQAYIDNRLKDHTEMLH
ncbi:MAG: NifB/NifX family molybdenum-iron cluster-binding protein [Actinobacteria bacterium]|nr:NifB/NifX family molybdenum-iron cluster-binding protein [Actinomycetota bacterium]